MSIGVSYAELGLWKEGYELLEKAAQSHAALYGEEDLRTLEARYQHAKSMVTSSPDDAIGLFRDLVDRWRVAGGPEHEQTLRVTGDLAQVLAITGAVEEAVPLARKTLERRSSPASSATSASPTSRPTSIRAGASTGTCRRRSTSWRAGAATVPCPA